MDHMCSTTSHTKETFGEGTNFFFLRPGTGRYLDLDFLSFDFSWSSLDTEAHSTGIVLMLVWAVTVCLLSSSAWLLMSIMSSKSLPVSLISVLVATSSIAGGRQTRFTEKIFRHFEYQSIQNWTKMNVIPYFHLYLTRTVWLVLKWIWTIMLYFE